MIFCLGVKRTGGQGQPISANYSEKAIYFYISVTYSVNTEISGMLSVGMSIYTVIFKLIQSVFY